MGRGPVPLPRQARERGWERLSGRGDWLPLLRAGRRRGNRTPGAYNDVAYEWLLGLPQARGRLSTWRSTKTLRGGIFKRAGTA